MGDLHDPAPFEDIATAPHDGTRIIAGKQSTWVKAFFHVPFPLESRFLAGRWCADFGDDKWLPYDPQPTHWLPPKVRRHSAQ